MGMFLTLLWRATLLRCPYCGEGKLYQKWFKMYDRCSVCGWRFEREEGYWTGAMAVNLVLTEFLVVAIGMPLAFVVAFQHLPVMQIFWLALPIPILLPFLFFRHAKSYWMSIDFMIHPIEPNEL